MNYYTDPEARCHKCKSVVSRHLMRCSVEWKPKKETEVTIRVWDDGHTELVTYDAMEFKADGEKMGSKNVTYVPKIITDGDDPNFDALAVGYLDDKKTNSMADIRYSKISKQVSKMGGWANFCHYINNTFVNDHEKYTKLIALVEDLALCENHLDGCRAKTHLQDDDFHCQCYDWDYYNFENLIEKARTIIKEDHSE